MTDETLFAVALEQRTPDERARYLTEACPDPEQRARLDGLLAAHDRAGRFLDRPALVADSATRSFSPGEDTKPADPPADEAADDLSFLAPSTRPDALGRLGQYDVLEVLGRGGFGIVFRAFDDKLQRVVAVKVLAPQMAATSPARKRFLREARSAAAVRHENVVQVHAVEEQPLPHLVMEYLPGETLQQRLDRTGPLDVAEVLRTGRQIAAGLAAAHAQGLIHRDIKPSNILLDTGPHPNVKITDFGLARAADDASLTRSGAVAGTPMYMAPEQARGEALDHRADLFSLGSVLYALLTGRPPFRAGNTPAVLKRVADDIPRPIREVIPETPEWLCRIVEKLHAKEPAERFQSAKEVADLLADCEKQLSERKELTDFSRIPITKRPEKPARRSMWAWVIGVALGLFAAGCAGLPVWGWYFWQFTSAERNDVPRSNGQRPPSADPSADGFTPLFDGKTLTGWKPHADNQAEWVVKDGALTATGGAGYLATERADYRDFHLRAEVKVNNTGNAGVIFRHSPAGRLTDPAGTHYEADITGGSLCHLFTRRGAREVNKLSSSDTLWAESWVVYEVVAAGGHLTVKLDGRVVIDTVEPTPLLAPGPIILESGTADTSVRFRKIEIKELPVEGPAVPTTAADFLPFVRGTWSRDGEVVFPKAEARKVGGQVAFDPVAGGTVLRGLNVDEHAVPTSLVLHKYDPAGDRLSSWYFAPDGMASASDAGQYDAATHIFTWVEKLPDGGHSTHNMTVMDANTVRARHLDTDAEGKFVFDARGTFTRSTLPPVVPKVVIDPKRPAEAAVLDRLVGEWRTQVTIKPPGKSAVEAWRTTGRATLGGRFVEVFSAGGSGVASEYAVVWYDPAAKCYRQWYFNGEGHAFPMTGTWDAATSTLTWETADKGKSDRWVFTGDDRWEFRHVVNDKDGKPVVEMTGVSSRRPDPPKAEVAERKKEVAALEKARDEAKLRFDAGRENKLHLLAAEVVLTEARLKLAEAEGNAKEVVTQLEALVAHRQEERGLIEARVEAELDRPAVLDAANARLADAKARLAKARPPKEGPKPP